MNMLVEQYNLYSFKKSQKFGKTYQTNIQELKYFLGINLLMGIKRSPSYIAQRGNNEDESSAMANRGKSFKSNL